MNPRAAITRQVHALLERETRINLHRHPVEISNANGVVVLEGELEDVAAKKLALELAASVPGVDGVVDRLRVKPGERRGDGAVRDSLLRMLLELRDVRPDYEDRDEEVTEVLEIVLEADPMVDPSQIRMACRDRTVTLEGSVPTEEQKSRAELDAWALFGVKRVINRLQVTD